MNKFDFKFVNVIPDKTNMELNTLYISVENKIAVHKCMCGCDEIVITPISPEGWHLFFDGDTVSLTPSIGNWNLKCKSHYYLKNNNVIWVKDDYNIKKKKKRKKWFWFN